MAMGCEGRDIAHHVGDSQGGDNCGGYVGCLSLSMDIVHVAVGMIETKAYQCTKVRGVI